MGNLSIDTLLTIGISLATAVGLIFGPLFLERYKILKASEEAYRSVHRQTVEGQKDLVAQYIDAVTKYVECIESDNDAAERSRLILQQKYETIHIKHRLVTEFNSILHWQIFDEFEDYKELMMAVKHQIVQEENLESILLNLIELEQKLIEKSSDENGSSIEEIKIFKDLIPMFMSDYIHLNQLSNATIENLFNRIDNYVEEVSREEALYDSIEKDSSFDFEIGDESVSDYYKRVFSYLSETIDGLGDKLEDYSGRLSLSTEVTWRNKVTIPIGPHSKTVTLNTNIKRNVAEDFITEVLEDIMEMEG
ncbi:hypothetical protein ODU07_04260 [Streptococcus suis]|nr:hypothetical protein [Streptococcus suis]